MLAGRKLLLADDSITIQKVVELTFSDEGVSVVCVNNGREAIERLGDFTPDIVLADVLMPERNGYEVCEYIKHNEKLKHIPVMLLVGSFEPYDEAEARRVGADDTLTKPFQSIRRLIDKVGGLVGSRPSEEQIPTAELPREPEPEPEVLSEQQLEIVTADTQPLPPEMASATMGSSFPGVEEIHALTEKAMDQEQTASAVSQTQARYSGRRGQANDMLLDLDYFEPARATDEFVLDIDLDEVPEPASESSSVSAYVGRQGYRVAERDMRKGDAGTLHDAPSSSNWSKPGAFEPPTPTLDQLAKTQEFPRPVITHDEELETTSANAAMTEPVATGASTAVSGGQITLEQLSPEVIDAIARRAVEQLSEKVVQEIAWEVVPQLAELMIKRQLEEKSS